MDKYIRVEWPEYQQFESHPKFKEECYYSADSNVYFIPEDLYNDILNKIYELPDEYKENYTTDFDRVKKDQNLLVFIYETEEFKVFKSLVNWNASFPFPILLKDSDFLDGINCDVVAIEK